MVTLSIEYERRRFMMNKFMRVSVLLLMMILFSGCATNNEARDQPNVENQSRTTNIQNVTNRNNNVVRNNVETGMEVANEAQEKVENMDEIRSANVIVTNRNAYVAVVLEDDTKGGLRRDLERKIAERVKSTDRGIRNVFVSSNPDFVDRMRDYGDKLQQGEPIEGLFEEFNEMVQRVFPTAR